ncbi:MAG: GntR family transcriptional regulator [Turicibacter sp.]|nr:GntR family transcriptional regulator [Turicibacter sp.]
MLNQNLPKYLAVSEWIKQNIYNHTFKAGEKLMSENKLCEKFSISRQTARQAIAILEKEGLISKKQGSGTYVNHTFFNSQSFSKTIGLIIPSLEQAIYPEIISGIEEILSDHDYHLLLRLTHHKVNTEREQLLTLLHSNIDGLIIEATKSALPNPNLDLYHQFLKRNIPLLFINSYYPSLTSSFIVMDNEKGGRLATQHFIQQGHKNITGIFKYDDIPGNLRYKGFLTEMYENKLSVNESAIIWYSTENEKQLFSPENFPSLLKKLNHSTAIICDNDLLAMKFMNLLATHSINVPEQLSLISFNNSYLNELGPLTLSSISYPKNELGKLAAESILTMSQNTDYEIKQIYEPTLIKRQSVKPL